VLYLFVVPLWQGPDEPAHFAYVALLDRYGLDDRAVQALSFGDDRRQGDPALVDAISASMEQHGFPQFVLGYGAPGSELGPNYAMFQEVRQPAPYYFICAAALRIARLLGVPADPVSNTDTALIVVRLVSLLMSLGVVILAWVAGALLSDGPWLRLLVPLTLVLFPQQLFMASLANNDAFAELMVSALFVTLVALLTRPFARRAPALAALALVLTLMTALTKGSAMAAALPLFCIGLLLWLGMLLSRWIGERWHYATGGRSRVGALLLLLLPLIGIAVVALLSVGPQDGEVADWTVGQADGAPVKRVAASDAHDGSYVMELTTPGGMGEAVQMLVPPVYHPAMNIQVRGWVRVPRLPAGSAHSQTAATMLLYSGSNPVAAAGVPYDAAGAWQPLSLSGSIADGGDSVTLKLIASDFGGVQFDDLSMQTAWPSTYWSVPFYRPVILNGSAELAATGVRGPVGRVVPTEARQIVGVLLNPQQYTLSELWGFYAREEYRSFWGNFGWLAIPLPDGLYVFLGALAAVAFAGLVLHAALRIGRWSAPEWLGLMSLLSIALAVIIGFSRQSMLLSLYGDAAFPQGRYLFVLIIPIAWLLLAGIATWWGLLGSAGRRLYGIVRNGGVQAEVRKEQHKGPPVKWQMLGAGAWVAMLLGFEVYCLVGLLIPYFNR
jgi:hypothetical protein